MNGYMGKALLVNLSEGSIETQEIPLSWYDDFLGGEGLGVRIFYDHMDPSREPFDPHTPVILATGPLNGTTAPEGGRLVLFFDRPQRHFGTFQRWRPFRSGPEESRV